jgi:hypothetical protein
LRIKPPKPVVAKSKIEVKSRVDWLCALRNFDSLISQTKKKLQWTLRKRCPLFYCIR